VRLTFRANNELALHVADPAAAAEFYTRVLGGTEVDRTADCIEVVSGPLRLFLLRDPATTHDRVVPSFDVPDRAAALARLQAAGCTLVPIGPHAPDGFYVRDPFGVVFDVVERAAAAPDFTGADADENSIELH
jgi:catechol 2,3-dioxygenase-like lactoylglutathione lyase family enzyme